MSPCRSPRTRGDGPSIAPASTLQATVLPAHAGMARWPPAWVIRARCVLPAHAGMARCWSVPGRSLENVLPAHAGMARSEPHPHHGPGRSPRTRGDGPVARSAGRTMVIVLPAHAGMARPNRPATLVSRRFSPHTRGWPVSTTAGGVTVTSSPRTRGDGPELFYLLRHLSRVLPAHAGMARSFDPLA